MIVDADAAAAASASPIAPCFSCAQPFAARSDGTSSSLLPPLFASTWLMRVVVTHLKPLVHIRRLVCKLRRAFSYSLGRSAPDLIS